MLLAELDMIIEQQFQGALDPVQALAAGWLLAIIHFPYFTELT
jgi:hypothetical protein